ncbi:hypothetical protein GTP44_20855 [Duganella sp. FT50W]|uniref:Uncharacterized protein n=1 Tax=Duganella lactea TaxID=2692173 RepID=A0A6L8MMH9_9BURK|nr:hypothetical protein [Duganella lactea]MYM84390.1 hypothetical protein [Duganella lactea]
MSSLFLCGDKRHIKDYASAFSNAIKQENDTTQQAAMRERLALIIATEISESERTEFQASVDSILGNSVRIEKKIEEAQDSKTLPDNESNLDEKIFMPGLFGRRSATKSAAQKLKTAEDNLKNRNFAAARKEAVATLREFQDGDWGIWGDLSSTATRAKEMLIITSCTTASSSMTGAEINPNSLKFLPP